MVIVEVPITVLPDEYVYVSVPVAFGNPDIRANVSVEVPSVELTN